MKDFVLIDDKPSTFNVLIFVKNCTPLLDMSSFPASKREREREIEREPDRTTKMWSSS